MTEMCVGLALAGPILVSTGRAAPLTGNFSNNLLEDG
jgi:hypothetical protein